MPSVPALPIPADPIPSMVGYPGSKAASGLAERIIRQMPPHNFYVEGYAGYAAVFRRKRPAGSSLLIDVDPNTCDHLRSYLVAAGVARAEVLCDDALRILPGLPAVQAPTTLLFLDPPYLRETRTRFLYDFEFATRESHGQLITLAKSLPCMIMLCGYGSTLYERRLKTWRLVRIPAMTRGGMRIEHLWCNFPEPQLLHDPRFAGANFRERERIKRKRLRWAKKFAAMDPRERQVIAAALVDVDRATVEATLQSGLKGESS